MTGGIDNSLKLSSMSENRALFRSIVPWDFAVLGERGSLVMLETHSTQWGPWRLKTMLKKHRWRAQRWWTFIKIQTWNSCYMLYLVLIGISLRINIHSILIFHSYPLSTSIWWLILKPSPPKYINPTKTWRSTSSQQTRRRQSIPIIPNNAMNPYFTRPCTCAWKKIRIFFRLSFPCPSRCRTIKKFLRIKVYLMRWFKNEDGQERTWGKKQSSIRYSWVFRL